MLARTDNDYDCELFGPTCLTYLETLSFGGVDRIDIETQLDVIEALDTQIAELDESIEEIVSIRTPTQLLTSISGVSYYSSLLITAETGEIVRFPSAK